MQERIVNSSVIDEGLIVDLPLQTLDLTEVQLSALFVVEASGLSLLVLLHELLEAFTLLLNVGLLNVSHELIIGLLDYELVLFEDLPYKPPQHLT